MVHSPATKRDCNRVVIGTKRKWYMVPNQWTKKKPAAAGWYWYRGLAHEADPFIVQVDEVGQFQWPDGGYQEVGLAKGEWAGPIQLPEDQDA